MTQPDNPRYAPMNENRQIIPMRFAQLLTGPMRRTRPIELAARAIAFVHGPTVSFLERTICHSCASGESFIVQVYSVGNRNVSGIYPECYTRLSVFLSSRFLARAASNYRPG